MRQNAEHLQINDSQGFVYDVTFDYQYRTGRAFAIYQGEIIVCIDRGKLSEPHSDDDFENERFEELLHEWIDSVHDDLKGLCEEYLNKLK